MYDFENKRIGFNGPIVDFAAPNPTSNFPIWIIIVVVVVIVIVAASIFAFIKIRNKKL